MKEKIRNKFLGISEPSDNRLRSLIILVVWMILITLLIFYVRSYNVNNPKEEVITFNNLGDIFSIYKDYNYEIIINDLDDNVTTYKGTMKNTIDTGVKTKGEESISYKVESNIITDTTTNTVIDNLYDDYLAYFFLPSNIYSYVSYLNGEEKEDKNIKTYTFKYVYDDKDIVFEIETTYDKLNNIVISHDDRIYNIKYIKI
ncbi:MAG: hypothetical protein E7159_03850 [Firmicutes bacterium]|nr:hypothetical protein [Bacillota bacterium]